MAIVKVHKVTSLPAVLDVNAVYYVKSGSSVSVYVTDSTGTPYNSESDPVYTASIPDQMMYKNSISSGANLNTYITTGFYSCTNAVSSTVINAPQSGSPFLLEVLRNTSSGLYIIQRATYNGNNGYKRFSGDGGTTWSTWAVIGTLTTETDPVYTASIPNQMMYKGIIPGSVNLNSYATTGKYLQNSDANAASGTNYPVARAGELEVTNHNNGEFYMQKYQAYNNFGYYQRSLYTASGSWSPWIRYIGSNEAVTWGVNPSGQMFNSYPGNSVLYCHSNNQTGMPFSGAGFAWNAALDNTSGIYSAQMIVGIGVGTANTVDQFWFRTNQQGGSGWPGDWLQVATRQWANTATIQNQNAIIQTADFRISGYAQVATGMEIGNYMGVYGSYTDGSIYINPHTITCARSGNSFTLFDFQGAGAGTVFNTMATAPFKFRYNNDPDHQMVFDQNLMIGVADSYVSSGERLQVSGSIRQTAVTSAMLKTDANGKIVAATAGTDYLDTGSVIQNQNTITQSAAFKIDGTGESTTTLASPTVKTNTIQPYSGSTLTLSASTLKVSNLAGGTANRSVIVDGTGSVTAGPVLESGTYTPTVTGDATFTVQGFTYQRIGNIVSVMGRLVCSSISTSTMSASITLPIASNLDNAYDLLGTVTGSGIAAAPNLIIADAAANKALVTAATAGGLSATIYLSFQYQILP